MQGGAAAEIVDGDRRLRLRNPRLISYQVRGVHVNNASKRVQEETFEFEFEDEFFITSRGSHCWSYREGRRCQPF